MTTPGGSSGGAAGCVECRDGLDHCHATWVRHPDGWGECLAVDCRVGPDAHLHLVVCTDVDPRCCA